MIDHAEMAHASQLSHSPSTPMSRSQVARIDTSALATIVSPFVN